MKVLTIWRDDFAAIMAAGRGTLHLPKCYHHLDAGDVLLMVRDAWNGPQRGRAVRVSDARTSEVTVERAPELDL